MLFDVAVREGCHVDAVPYRSEVTRSPLHRQLVERLLPWIQSGELTSGQPLPTEARLMREHGVSRTTARRALDELAERGLVRREVGRGTFVAIPSFVVDLPHLLGLTAAIVAAGHAPLTRLLLRERRPAGEAVAARLGIAPRDPVLRLRHLCSAGDQPLLICDSRVNIARLPSLEHADLPGLSVLEAAVAGVGGRIACTRYRVDALGASAEMAGLLGVRRTSPVLRLERVVHLGDGVAVETAAIDLHPGRCRCHGEAGGLGRGG
jgi:GntR family transcriptional regulator